MLSEGRPLPALYENAAVYEFDKRFLGRFEVVVEGAKMRTCHCSMCHLRKFESSFQYPGDVEATRTTAEDLR